MWKNERIRKKIYLITCKIALLDFGEGWTGIEAVISDQYTEEEEKEEFIRWITEEMNIEVELN